MESWASGANPNWEVTCRGRRPEGSGELDGIDESYSGPPGAQKKPGKAAETVETGTCKFRVPVSCAFPSPQLMSPAARGQSGLNIGTTQAWKREYLEAKKGWN